MKWKKYLAGTIAVLVSVSAVMPKGAEPAVVQAAAIAEESGAAAVSENTEESISENTESSVFAINAAGYTAASASELQQCINQIASGSSRGNITNPVSIKIAAGFDVNAAITIPAGTFVKIYGEASEGTSAFPVLKNLNTDKKDGGVFRVDGGLVLENITLTATGLSGVYISNSGTFRMESGAVIQNGNVFLDTTDGKTVHNYYGGGVTNYGTFVMNGGVIKNCRNSGTGASASIKVPGTDENGNTVEQTLSVSDRLYGGGVYNAGTFTMTGGEITGNTVYAHEGNWECRGYGSGVANGSSGIFTMTGGTISGNNGEMGAGVYNAGVMELAGGNIQANIGSTDRTKDNHISLGSGIYNDGTLTFTGGYITGNTAGKGAGVYTAGRFTMAGEAVISKNTAQVAAIGRGFSCGGGVYVASGTFELNGGTILSNIANSTASTSTSGMNSNRGYERDTFYSDYSVVGNGGGVFVANGGAVFTMTGGEISGNVARGNKVTEDIARQGGGVYVQGGASEETSDRTAVPGGFVMAGGTITKNAAQSGGDGVYIGNYDYFVANTGLAGSSGNKPGTVYQFEGAARFELGGTAAITANTNEDICLSDGVQIQITAPLAVSGEMRVSSGDKSENAVLAVYSDADNYQETDAGLFLPGMNDIRTVAYDPGRQVLYLRKQRLDDTYTIGLSFESVVYSGQEQKPAVTVTKADGAVLPESEYTVSYQKNTDTGTAVVVVNAATAGNYSGSIRKDFVITPKNISSSGSRIAATANDLTQGTYSAWYTGNEIKPSVSLIVLKDQDRGVQMLRNKDYVVTFSGNTEAGTGKVIVTGIGNYMGTITYPFSIKKKSIGDMSISKVADQKYTGAKIAPTLTIKDGSTVLKKDTDYSIVYTNNTAAGTATITITGKGFYSGTKQVTFRIAPKSISGASVRTIANQAYTGKVIRPEPAVKLGNVILKKGKDYTLSYKNNTKTGKATVTITGIGNYTGKRTTTFRIAPKKAVLKSVTSTKKKQLTVKWKKDAQASGYQIMIAGNAKFTSGKKTKTVTKNTQLTATFTGLKRGKKYYAAIRSYKKIDGKKVYGAWSSYKTKKVK